MCPSPPTSPPARPLSLECSNSSSITDPHMDHTRNAVTASCCLTPASVWPGQWPPRRTLNPNPSQPSPLSHSLNPSPSTYSTPFTKPNSSLTNSIPTLPSLIQPHPSPTHSTPPLPSIFKPHTYPHSLNPNPSLTHSTPTLPSFTQPNLSLTHSTPPLSSLTQPHRFPHSLIPTPSLTHP